MASSHPSHLTSIIPDPAPSGRFSLHGLGTLLLPPASQPGFKHRNRNTALVSASRTLDRHSRGTGESEWEDLGDADHALDEVKRDARLAAWTTLTSSVAPLVVLGEVSARSTNREAAGLPPLARSRSGSISTASLSIDLDALPSVTSHLNSPFTPVVDRFSTSVWEETQFSAMRSSTDLVHGSLESTNALADLISRLGLDDDGAEKQPLSNKPPGERKSTVEVPIRPVTNGTLFDGQQAVITPAERPLPPLPTAPKRATMSAPYPSTLDHSTSPLPAPDFFSLGKGPNLSFHPILDIEVKKFSVPVTSAPEAVPFYMYRSRDRQVPDPSGPRNKRKSFLPDMSPETRPKKFKRPFTAPQPSRPYMDRLPPSLDSLLPGRQGKGQTGNVFPKLLSRSAKPVPPYWPPAAPSQFRPLTQDSVVRIPLARPNTPKDSRVKHRASRMDASECSFGSSFPPLPIMSNHSTQ